MFTLFLVGFAVSFAALIAWIWFKPPAGRKGTHRPPPTSDAPVPAYRGRPNPTLKAKATPYAADTVPAVRDTDMTGTTDDSGVLGAITDIVPDIFERLSDHASPHSDTSQYNPSTPEADQPSSYGGYESASHHDSGSSSWDSSSHDTSFDSCGGDFGGDCDAGCGGD